ncbi:MAG: tetratricopeptide repeat protein [Woronichinia naegeliana WA131]|uniref:Tetratricopeptide repeat protein n=1 Tax=Woronichinia naegeliana WA131 TaxID=2824559 RepID=A0A977L2U5_9CYAN|nr:MAG: tetratricopeptide repeat protein [Woronichinia naegeliana WA131]
MDGLVSCLQSGRFLLVVDNLESLLTAEGQWSSEFYGDFFSAWLELGSNSTILVTTREKPDLRGMEWLDLTGLSITEGANLLAELGIQGNLAEFSALVGGYPLLLKLVADLLKDEYPQDPHLERLTALGLGNLQQLLTDERVKGVHRRQTVVIVAVLEAMVARLSPQQRHFWQRLSVFRPAFDSEAASYLVQEGPETLVPSNVGGLGGQNDLRTVETELRKLVKCSLLQEFLQDNRRYFDFQPVVREYACYGAADLTEAHHQAIAFYRSIAEPNPQSKQAVEPYLEIFHHCCELGEYGTAFDVIREVDTFLTLRGFYTVRVDTYSRLVTAWEKAGLRDHWQYGAALTSLGNAYFSLGEYQRAIAFHQQSLEIERKIGNKKGEAASLGGLGNAYRSLGEYQRAIAFHQQSLEIAREIGDRQGEAGSLNNLGNAYRSLGKYQRAITFHQQSLEISREIGDRRGEAASLGNLGSAYNALGEYQRAIAFHQQYLDIAREVGDRQGEAASLGGLGSSYFSLGEYQRAMTFDQQHLDIAREIGDRQGEANSLGNFGIFYNLLGEYQRAIAFYQQSLEIKRKMRDRQGEANSLGNFGNAYLLLGEYQQAIAFYQQQLDIAREIGDRRGEANALGNLGNAYLLLGEDQRAIAFHQQHLDIAREIGHRQGEAIAWFNLGLALKELQRAADALGAFRNARQLYQAMELESIVQNCDNEINALSAPISPSPPPTLWQRIRQILRRFWRWISHLFH